MKKTELIGEFRASGREWQPCGKPIEVLIHDLVDKNLGKLSYCGVCDLTENQGWVGVWTDHDTAWFAAEAIRRWWFKMGCHTHWQARELLITEDGGGNVNVRHTVDPCQSPSSPVHTAAPRDRATPPKPSDEAAHSAQISHPPLSVPGWFQVQRDKIPIRYGLLCKGGPPGIRLRRKKHRPMDD
jgi:hypothetical protein